MERANAFKIALLGATALTLVACGEAKEEVLAYDSVEACITAGQQDESACRTEFAKAEKLHEEVAPRYDRASDCNSDFGHNRCYQYRTSAGSSVWLPFMMGYMLAPAAGGASSRRSRSTAQVQIPISYIRRETAGSARSRQTAVPRSPILRLAGLRYVPALSQGEDSALGQRVDLAPEAELKRAFCKGLFQRSLILTVGINHHGV